MNQVRQFTLWEQIELWWAVQGQLGYELVTYYTICSLAGYLQGWYIGTKLAGLL